MKYIKGYEETYSITEDGAVYSHRRGIFLKQHINNAGYYRVCLSKNGKQAFFFTHRLVAQTHIGVGGAGTVVNHKDGDKLNNSVDNLEWCTPKQNIAHAMGLGLMRRHITNHGTMNEYMNYGCRCRECKGANATYCRPRVDKWRATQREKVGV